MATKKTGTTFEDVMRDLRAGKFAPVYILMGEEAYYIDQISNFIMENALSPEECDFNLSVFFGVDVQPSQIVDTARRFPMMAPRQVVVVKEAQNLKSLDLIEKYIEKPVGTTILVICYKNAAIDGRKKILAKASIKGVVFNSEKIKDQDLPRFVEDYVKSKGAKIDVKSSHMVAEHIGSDLCRITSEIDKVLLSLPEDKKQITPEVIEDRVGISKDFNGFELKNAIVEHDIYKASLIVEYFRSSPKTSKTNKSNAYSIVYLLFSYFQNLLIAYYTPNPKTQESIAQNLELYPSWRAREYIEGMRNYSGNKVMKIISKIREIDAKSKGINNPNTPMEELLRELIFYILY